MLQALCSTCSGIWTLDQVRGEKEILFQQDPQYFDFGTPLGKDLYGIRPDLIKIAKGLVSSYLQLFRVIIGERVWKVIEQIPDELGPRGHGSNYSGHPLCANARAGKP